MSGDENGVGLVHGGKRNAGARRCQKNANGGLRSSNWNGTTREKGDELSLRRGAAIESTKLPNALRETVARSCGCAAALPKH